MGDSPGEGVGGRDACRASTQIIGATPFPQALPAKEAKERPPQVKGQRPLRGGAPAPPLTWGPGLPKSQTRGRAWGKITLQHLPLHLPLVNSRKNETNISNPKTREQSTRTKSPPPLLKSSKSEIKNFSNKVRNCSTKITLEESRKSSFRTERKAKILFWIFSPFIPGPAYHMAQKKHHMPGS
jgi:hypothetical protein